MAQNTNIINSLNIIQSLLDKKNIDDSTKDLFYYVSNLYLVSKGLDPFFFANYFCSENIKKEDMIDSFGEYAYKDSLNKKPIVTDEDVLESFLEFDLKINKRFKVDEFYAFAVSFKEKTIKERLDFVNKYLIVNKWRVPTFIYTILYHCGNEEIKNMVAKDCYRGINLERYGSYAILDSLYNIVGESEFTQITSNKGGLINSPVADESNANKKTEIKNIDIDIDIFVMLEIVPKAFLALKNGDEDSVRECLFKIFEIYQNANYINSEGKERHKIAGLFFIKRIVPKIVFYNNHLKNDAKQEVLSRLIDACIVSSSRTSLKNRKFLKELALFEIIRNIVELELDPCNHDVEYRPL